MKRGLLSVAALALLFALTGCHHNTCNNCNHCGPGGQMAGGHGAHHRGGADYVPPMGHHAHLQTMGGPAGPPSAAIGYPYYTNRAPRDFLLDNPASIGY